MGTPKYKHLFGEPSTKRKVDRSSGNETDKVTINNMLKIISEKIKDPEMAKKAAQIISEMINKK